MDAPTIARAQNIATNGRWFCAGVAVINYLGGSPALAFLMLFTLALAIAADILRANAFSLFVYAYAAWVTFLSALNVW